jgi:hypothetical protein
VESVRVRRGDIVSAGQVLVTLDDEMDGAVDPRPARLPPDRGSGGSTGKIMASR